MKNESQQLKVYLIALGFIVTFALLRWAAGGFDFSTFISAGSDFVNINETPSKIIVNEGQGYDGQFFYRLALDPFNLSQDLYGVKIDFPSYRSQRIMYPLIVWICSFGGIPAMVPFSLVLVNLLSFAGLYFFFLKIAKHFTEDFKLLVLPIFLFGVYMSIAKDLSEVTELFFYTGAVYFMIKKKWWQFALFSSLTLLTRETALIALAPIALTIFLKSNPINLKRVLTIGLPFIVWISWKYYITLSTGTSNQIEGSGNITFPFMGIFPGFMANIDFSSFQKILQLAFWIAYFLWQIWLIAIIVGTILKNESGSVNFQNPLTGAYLSWLLFAIVLSPAIYVDDWSFVRVFSLWNMTGILILVSAKKIPGKWFYSFSALLLLLTCIRLIIRQ